MQTLNNKWKGDNYKFVGKSFDYNYKSIQDMFPLSRIINEKVTDSVDYEITGSDGYGEYAPYDGSNLIQGSQSRGFKTIITPKEYNKYIDLKYKQVLNDKFGETKKVGQKLGRNGAITVQQHILRSFGNAWNSDYVGGDGRAWAATDHPSASKEDTNRGYVIDTEKGTYSNSFTYDLTAGNIGLIQQAAKRLTTPDGSPLTGNYNLLLVSPELETEAKRICGDMNKLRPMLDPDDDSNSANPVYDLTYAVVGAGNDGFTGKQWALANSLMFGSEEGLNVVYNTKPSIFESELDNPLIQRFVGYIDFAIGWGDPRAIMFSNAN